MAADMFIKIDGIKGESNDSKHPDEIEVLSWSWGMSNAGSAHVGSGQGASKVNINDLVIQKSLDKSTPPLMLASITGKHIKEATLVVRKAAGDEPLEYLTITMQDILVSSVSNSGMQGGGAISESITLNFAKVKLKYIEQKADGGEGAKPDYGWDIRAHKNWT